MRTLSLLTGAVILLCVTAQYSAAASDKCVVVTSGENQLVIECSKAVSGFAPGSEVKIKSVKKAAIEGC
jgi:hypothetical protein